MCQLDCEIPNKKIVSNNVRCLLLIRVIVEGTCSSGGINTIRVTHSLKMKKQKKKLILFLAS